MSNYTEITDKDLMVYLVAKGFEIKDIKRNGNRSIVIFSEAPGLREASISFVNRQNMVNIADLLAAEKRIKTILCMNGR